MKKVLQDMFVESKGQPLQVENWTVQQAARIPARNAAVTIRFLSGSRESQGIRLSVKDGGIELSDRSRVKAVDTWFDPSLPDEVTYSVRTRSGFVLLWNIYCVSHPNGDVTQDMWTGNAGMVLLSEENNIRRYGCSPGGTSDFAPLSFVIEVEWREDSQLGR